MKHQLSDEEFSAVRRILENSAGLVQDDTRRDSLAFSVAGRVEAVGSPSVAAYLALLSSAYGEIERQRLIDVVTIQETHFFRNPPQIRALRQFVLPELVRRSMGEQRPLTIWSAGCSTGEEPYSIAMLIRELAPMATTEHVRILGSDVSVSALDFAAEARYGARAVQMTEPGDLARWFVTDGDGYRVKDDVRELVELRTHNLVTEPPPFEPGEVDLLLCRNVTIYFSRTTTKALMARFHTVLADGGYLFLGHSETLWQLSDEFTLVSLGDAFVYRRDDTRTDAPTLPERRTEAGDPPVSVAERRARGDRRRRAGQLAETGRSIRLPGGPVVPPARPVGEPRLRSVLPAGSDALPPADVRAQARGGLEAARAALTAGRYREAATFAAEVARGNPLEAEAHLVFGEALVNLGRDTEAVVELRQAAYLQPACAPAHLLLAGALDRLDEPAAAGRAYRAAAATVGYLPPDAMVGIFGGRPAAELVELCIRLAMQAERAARMKGRQGR